MIASLSFVVVVVVVVVVFFNVSFCSVPEPGPPYSVHICGNVVFYARLQFL